MPPEFRPLFALITPVSDLINNFHHLPSFTTINADRHSELITVSNGCVTQATILNAG